MSFEGNGTASIGLAAGGVAALGAAAVVGLGILAVRGVMWCGKKMDENYQRACQEWQDLNEAAYAANRANVQDMPALIGWQVERIAAARANLTLETATVASAEGPSATQKELVDALARARMALENAQDATQIKIAAQHELAAYRLKSEIEATRGLLPANQIAQAEAALNGSVETMEIALRELQTAWQSIPHTPAVNAHQERKARQLISAVNAQLTTIDLMLHNAGKAQGPGYATRKHDIKSKVVDAQYTLEHDASTALALAEEAQKDVQELTRLVSADTLGTWDQARRKIITLQGTLDSLTTMIKEAVALRLIETQYEQDINRRLAAAQTEAEGLRQETSARMQQRFALLNTRVEMLQEEVFRVVKTKQQSQLAQTIATTLAELGFRSDLGGQPVTQENGDVVRVVATRPPKVPTSVRDDRLVSFDISRDGNINYDFSGYVGNACVSEAWEVFAALRNKGIFILDDKAMEELRKVPANSLTTDTLRQERFAPQIIQNKAQAELAEHLQEVFKRMQFTNIQLSTIGGSIDIEAFNGPTGYHVILPPDGTAQVYKNHTDVSATISDPIVKEVISEPQEIALAADEDERARSRDLYRQQAAMRRKQMLGQ